MNYVITICTVTGDEVEVAAFAAKHVTPYTDAPNQAYFNFRTILPNPAGPDAWGGATSSGHDYALRAREHGKMAFQFLTEWAFPFPIFRQLATLYPHLVFDVAVYEECYEGECTGAGEFNGKNDFHAVDPTPALEARAKAHAAQKAHAAVK